VSEGRFDAHREMGNCARARAIVSNFAYTGPANYQQPSGRRLVSVFHFRAELVEQKANGARYRFQTDYVGDSQRVGMFSLDISTWTWCIDESADSRCYADGTSRDAHCVAALTHKIRKTYPLEGLPAIVFHIA